MQPLVVRAGPSSKVRPRKKEEKYLLTVARAVEKIEDKVFAPKVARFLRACIYSKIWPRLIETYPSASIQWRPFPEELHHSLVQVQTIELSSYFVRST